jgi:carboxypeptidase T
MKKLYITLGLFFFVFAALSQNYSRIKIQLQPNTLETLGTMGIPVEGAVHKGLYLITELRTDQLAELSAADIQFEVLIDDVADFYVHRNLAAPENTQTRNCGEPLFYPVPSNFTLGSMGGFFTLAEIYEELDSMRARFPQLVSQRQTIGSFTTHQGRSLYYIKLSDNPDVNEAEPKIYYQSLVHAREPMGMQQLFFYMWYLLENYSTDPEIQYMLDHCEMYFVPCGNPDGYEYNRQTQPAGGGLWRKNRRNNGSSYGVDLNRNFGYMWGYDNVGSSPTAGDETYRGPSAFSEPETQAIKSLCESVQPVLLLDYHTYSDVLLFPWGYINQICPDSNLYDVYSSYLISENKFAYGTAFQTIGYNANGGSIDWYYGEQFTKDKIISWCPEAGNADDGFWPQQSRITTIAMNYMAMNLYLARFALKYAEVNDLTSTWIDGNLQYFKYDITRLGMEENGTFTVSLHSLSNVNIVGSPKVYSNLALLESRIDSIEYHVVPAVVPGDQLAFVVEVNNGHYSHFDTIRKVYGEAVEVMNDPCSSLTAWTGNWALTSSHYVSAPSSITDSPTGPYQNNSTKTITTVNSIDLTDAVDARLTFWAKWDIEAGWDFVQVMISADNGSTWTPLCGKYSVNGTSYQDENQPVYDGIKSQWVQEEINLSNWIGQQVKFRFRLVSDNYTVGDGFYFDDFLVEVIMPDTTTSFGDHAEDNGLKIFPNPAQDMVRIVSEKEIIRFLRVNGIDGKEYLHTEVNSDMVILDVSQFPQGIYFVHVSTAQSTVIHKVVVLK